jgi:hypothetical protein
MAQTKRKRRRKRRGTQGGSIDRRPARGRPRNRAEAQARARGRSKKKAKPGERVPNPPSWSGALKKGGVAAALFVGILLIMGQSPAAVVAIAVLILPFYTGMSYVLDRFFYQRYLRKEAQKRADRESKRAGPRQAEN